MGGQLYIFWALQRLRGKVLFRSGPFNLVSKQSGNLSTHAAQRTDWLTPNLSGCRAAVRRCRAGWFRVRGPVRLLPAETGEDRDTAGGALLSGRLSFSPEAVRLDKKKDVRFKKTWPTP